MARSAGGLLRAYHFLRGRRHTNMFVLAGDIEAWRGRGYALERWASALG